MELKIYNPAEDGFLKSIDWNFDELKQEIVKKADDYMNLVYSNDQIKEAKKDRANLRKFISALEDKRKEIKKQVMIPYTDFEAKEKELVGIVDQAVSNIDTQIKGYEEATRQEKLAKVKDIYTECIGDLDRTVPFEKVFKDSWLNATTTLKSIREEISSLYKKIDQELKIINADTSSYVYEMKEEYLKNFDLSAAMAKKQELEETAKKKAMFEEQKKKEEEAKNRRLAEEAAKVEKAGKHKKTLSEETEPIQESKPQDKERMLSITFKAVAKESQFKEVNVLLSKLQKCTESFVVISKEEL